MSTSEIAEQIMRNANALCKQGIPTATDKYFTPWEVSIIEVYVRELQAEREELRRDYDTAIEELDTLRCAGDFSDAPDQSIHASCFIQDARKKQLLRSPLTKKDATNG